MGWYEERFVQAENRLRFDCIGCGRGMWFPQSKHGKYRTCGSACAELVSERRLKERARACETCSKVFHPRHSQLRMGHGRYCSQACNTAAAAAINTEAAKTKAKQEMAALRKAGLIKVRRGEQSPSWNGGPLEAAARRRQYVANYKKQNPGKVAAWAANRRKNSVGKLDGAVSDDLFRLQRGRCAACKCSLAKDGAHLDHIIPLALGGRNERANVQLLCPKCNLKKAAKRPEQFMREMGFLL